MRGPAVPLERWFLRFALGASVIVYVSLVLAELGRLRMGMVLVLAFVMVCALQVALRRWAGRQESYGAKKEAAAVPATHSLVEVAALLLLCAVLFFPPYEAVVSGSDATVYANWGRKVAEAGALVFEDAFVEGLPADARAELFENRTQFRRTGRLHRFPGGFQIASATEPIVSASFAPLFPVLAALLHQLGVPHGSLYVAPLSATLAIIGLFLVAAHLGGRRAAWLTVALTLAAMPQLWFARMPMPETVAQCFVMAGLLAWLVALRDGAPRWAVAAGWFFGLACFAKVDLNVLLSVSLVVFAAWRGLTRPAQGAGPLGWLLASFVPLVVHNVAHYLIFPTDYAPVVEDLVRLSVPRELLGRIGPMARTIAALATVGLAVAALRSSVRTRRRASGIALAIGVVVYFYNYSSTITMRIEETVGSLSWYVSWPLLLVGACASLWLVAGRPGRDAGAALVVTLLAVVGLTYLYSPLESPVHVFSMRRFVPVVLPLLMLVVSLGIMAGLTRVAPRYRLVTAVTVGLLLVGLVARPSLAVLGKPFWASAIAQTAEIARMFPTGAVVLMSAGLLGTHIPTTLGYLHDIDTVLVQDRNPPSQLMERSVQDWLASGRQVFFAFVNYDDFSFFAPGLTLGEVQNASVDVLMLERTLTRLPQAAVQSSVPLQVYRVSPHLADRVAVDIGDPADDTFFDLRGFHGAERGAQEPDATFRWTSRRASFTLPASADVTLTVAGGRPAGVAPADISVWVNGVLAAGPLVLANAPETVRVSVPHASGLVELMIESTVFNPQALGLVPPDTRDLGVQIYRVDFEALVP